LVPNPIFPESMVDEVIDLEALRLSIRDVFRAECSPRAVLHHIEGGGGVHETLWKQAGSLGWTSLALPEAFGGLGLGLDALAVLYEEAGRAVAPIPLLATLLAADVIARTGSPEQQERWLRSIAGGSTIAAVSSPHPFAAAELTLAERDGHIILSGTARGILDGADAELILVLAARSDGSVARVAIEPQTDGVAVRRNSTWDLTRSLATVEVTDLTLPDNRMLPASTSSEDALAMHAAIGIAADAIGGSEEILSITIEYLKSRQQFGRPIGSFQGLKHRVANHKVALIADAALVTSAAALEASNDRLAGAEVSSAKAQACADYVNLGRDAIQLHGGIGFTAEHACHLFLKRARLNEVLFGSGSWHLQRVLDLVIRSLAA